MSSRLPKRTGQEGSSLLEVALTLGVISLLSLSFGFAVPTLMENSREDSVSGQLLRVKQAIVGEPSGVRIGAALINRFGYWGDMGAFPTNLEDLLTIGSQPGYDVTSIIEVGAGWRGPYIATTPLDFTEDPWGNPLEFNTTGTTSADTGSAVISTIRSTGRDGVSGNDDDHVIEIYDGEAASDLFGYVQDTRGATIPGVTVKIFYPVDGVLADPSSDAFTDSAVTDADGFYTFASVPHGERVIMIEPNLSYRQDTAFTTTNFLSDMEFTIENQGRDSTTVDSFTITYTSVPDAFFEQVWIGGVQVQNETNPRFGSGDTVTFSDQVVTGTDVIPDPLHVVVSSLAFQVPLINVDTVGSGGTLEIELQGFSDTESGGATDVNMTGVTFEIVFSDGSTTLLTTKQEP